MLAAPDDDAPRLVYADWLLERDDPRGELITVQCEIARLGPGADAAEVEALNKREQLLLAKHQAAWTSYLPPHCGGTFRRGFMETLDCSFDAFSKAAPLVLAREPVGSLEIRTMRSDDCSEHLRNFVSNPLLLRFRSLNLGANAVLDAGARALGSSANVAGLQTLDLTDCKITGWGVVGLTENASFRRLRVLDLTGNELIGDEGATAAVKRAPGFPSLERLNLSLAGVGVKGAAGLGSVRMPTLRALELAMNQAIGDAGVAKLIAGPLLETVRELVLYKCKLTDKSAKAIAGARTLKNLETLWLDTNAITLKGALALAASPLLPALSFVGLRETKVTEVPESNRVRFNLF